MNNVLNDLVGENNWVSFCVSLAKCHNRRHNFQEWCKTIDLKCNFWDAVDKNDLKENEVYTYVNNGFTQFLSPGATACSMSHIALCKYLLEHFTCDYFLIFEDDAGFKKSNKTELCSFIKNIKKSNIQWNILWFGYHETGYQDRFAVTENIQFIRSCHLSHAFLIDRKSCQRLVEIYDSHKSLAYDWILDIVKKEGSCLGPNNTIIDQVDAESTIGYIPGTDMFSV